MTLATTPPMRPPTITFDVLIAMTTSRCAVGGWGCTRRLRRSHHTASAARWLPRRAGGDVTTEEPGSHASHLDAEKLDAGLAVGVEISASGEGLSSPTDVSTLKASPAS